MSESCWSLRQRWPTEGLPVCRKSDSNTDWPSPETGMTSPEQSQAIGGCRGAASSQCWPGHRITISSAQAAFGMCRSGCGVNY